MKKSRAAVPSTARFCLGLAAILGFAALSCPLDAAGPRASADYSIATDSVDAGGRRTASTNYANDGSIGGIAGLPASAASAAENFRNGYAGQLFEIVGLTLSTPQIRLDSGATLALSAAQLLDDGSLLILAPASVDWSVVSGPIVSISVGGIATAGSVDQTTVAAVKGSFSGNTAQLTFTVMAANTQDAFTLNPASLTVTSGRSVVFNASATGTPTPTYQWTFNGTPIFGATDAVLLISGATSGSAGTYACVATNSNGSTRSNSATLTVGTASNPGYLVNLSARAAIGTGNNILIGGYAIGGTGTKQLLVRGAGPTLGAFFGSGSLATPQLTLLNGGAVIASNTAWASAPTPGPSAATDAPEVAASTILMNNVGAYPYQAGSFDTAMVVTAALGNSTAQVSGVGSATGIGLVEFYDADTTTPTSHLVNISARAQVGTGNNILIGGFAVGGATAETVLIRAVGPGLNDLLPGFFPLTSVLTQPVLTIFQGGTAIYSNTIWGGDAAIASVFPTVGAFGLVPGHQDSVLLLTLAPGNYTAQVSGLNGGTGIALCEIYEVY